MWRALIPLPLLSHQSHTPTKLHSPSIYFPAYFTLGTNQGNKGTLLYIRTSNKQNKNSAVPIPVNKYLCSLKGNFKDIISISSSEQLVETFDI
jgi:hypothetical protein